MVALSTSVETPPEGTYTLDPGRCTISYHASLLFSGKVHGVFAVTGGELVVARPVEQSCITARADARSITTSKPARDRLVRSKRFLDVETFPDLVFTSTSVGEEQGRAVIRGDLTAHGRTALICLKLLQVTSTRGTVTLRAYGKVDRRAFGISSARWVAGRYLNVEITVVAVAR